MSRLTSALGSAVGVAAGAAATEWWYGRQSGGQAPGEYLVFGALGGAMVGAAFGAGSVAHSAMGSLNTYDGPYPAGVPNPFGMRMHAYPTRYHGPVYTRPMYALDWMDRPYDFGVQRGTAGLGQEAAAAAVAVEPRTVMDCDAAYPAPDEVSSADGFAAYLQNQACVERVRQSKDSRRWLVGLGIAFVGGFWLGKKAA